MVGHQPRSIPTPEPPTCCDRFGDITPAELRVLRFVALGMTSREIAERLWVSRQAVTYHIGNLFMKFRADTRAGLVARAYAMGICPPELASRDRPGLRLVAFAARSRRSWKRLSPGERWEGPQRLPRSASAEHLSPQRPDEAYRMR